MSFLIKLSFIILLLAQPLLAGGLPALIPLLLEVSAADGHLLLTSPCTIASAPPADATRLVQVLRAAGMTVTRADGKSPGMIRLHRSEIKNPFAFAGAYQLEVSPNGIEITAPDSAEYSMAVPPAFSASRFRDLLRRKRVMDPACRGNSGFHRRAMIAGSGSPPGAAAAQP